MSQQIQIYQDPNGEMQIEVQFEKDTVWLNRHQMSVLFGRDIKTIGKHINNVFKEQELLKNSVVAKFATTALDGKTYQVEYYNLDVIISVGYRVKSKQGTQFRIWATSKLKELLVKGYAINQKRLAQKEQELKVLKDGIHILKRAWSNQPTDAKGWLESFARGLSLLDDYDHENLDAKGNTVQETNYPSLEDYWALVEMMRKEFDSAVFGKEKDQNFQSSIAQIGKGIGEEDFYPSLEEKAAMLLYLITKNHSFVDGNKRIAAGCFLLFLERNDMLFNSDGSTILSNEALASLTLFIASSKPEEKETVKRLVISVLNRNKM